MILVELELFLDTLSARDQQILLALGNGEDPADIAEAFTTSSDNVYQIRKRAKERYHVWCATRSVEGK
jgi:DNA-directed RNA polymerase specialized sigma24 family protein